MSDPDISGNWCCTHEQELDALRAEVERLRTKLEHPSVTTREWKHLVDLQKSENERLQSDRARLVAALTALEAQTRVRRGTATGIANHVQHYWNIVERAKYKAALDNARALLREFGAWRELGGRK